MKKLFNTISTFLKETDLYLLTMCFVASVFGIIMVTSATKYTLTDGQIL